jgi:UV DNA damage endonuclease
MSQDLDIQLGLCCLNTTMRQLKPPVFSSRSIILKTFNDKGFDYLKEKIIQNLQDTLKLIEWNENNGIKVFRLSSELFPHKSNPLAPEYSLDFAKDLLKQIGDLSKKYGQRLTFHPGQYNVIGTPNQDIFEKTCMDLKYHADVLDLMGLDNNSVIVIHGGGVYGDKQATITRWCERFYKLPDNVRSRIVLENCEKNFSIVDCLKVSSIINIPVVFDSHHFECYKLLHPDEEFLHPREYIFDILQTWDNRNIKPKFHVSEQGSGKCGHHSDFIEELPDYFLEIPEIYGVPIDIMIEAKMKELAIFKLYNKYPYLDCKIYNKKTPFIVHKKKNINKMIINAMKWTSLDCDCC